MSVSPDRRINVRRATVLRTGLIVVVAAIFLLAACGDATGPGASPPEGPSEPLTIQRIVTWEEGYPDERQAGDYRYDDLGRIAEFEFSVERSAGFVPTIRKEFSYLEDDRIRSIETFVRPIGQPDWRLTRTQYYGYHGQDRPVEIYTEDLDEQGTVVVRTLGLGYDEHGQLVEIRDGPQTIAYSYDAHGDAVRIRSHDIRFHPQVGTFTYSEVWDPLAEMPPRAGASPYIAVFGAGLHLSASFENAVEGEEPAARGEATVSANDHGYPTRWTYTFWNTASPDARMTVVTEFEYVETTPDG